MNKAALILVVLATTLIFSGCGNRFWEDTKRKSGDTYDYVFDTAPTATAFHDQSSIPLIELNNQAADVLSSNISQYELSKKSTVFVTVFTNQNDPDDHSIFGKVMTEQIADRLVQRGLVITEGEPQPNDYFLPKGVDPKKYSDVTSGSLDKLPPRAGMLSGSYVIGDDYIYMSGKITRLDDKAVVSAHTWTIPINDNVRQLIPQLRRDDGLEPTVKTKFD